MKVKNLLDEFPYWDIDNGVMVLADRTCEAGLRLSLLPDLTPISNVTAMQKAAMRAIPPGSRLRFMTNVGRAPDTVIKDYVSRTTAEDSFSSRITEARANHLESLRRDGYLTSWDTTVSVCLNPRIKPDNKKRKAIADLELDERIEAITRVRTSLERFLAQAGFDPRPMTTQDIYETIYRYVNPGDDFVELGDYEPTHQRYPRKAVKMYEGLRPPTLSAQLLKSPIDNRRAGYLLVGDMYVMMLAMHCEPDEVFPLLGNVLIGTSLDCSVIIDLIHQQQGETIRGVKGANQRNGASGSKGMYLDSDVTESLDQGRGLLTYLTRTGEHMYQTSVLVVLRGRDLDELRYTADIALSGFAKVPGAPFKRLKQGLKEPFIMGAPFNGRSYEEFVSLVEKHASYFLPVNGPWKGSKEAQAVYHTRYNTLATHYTFDPRNKNKHALFLGATRSGKTFTAQFQASEELRDARVDLRVVDRGLSWERVIKKFGGVVIPVEAGGGVCINPFDLPEGETKPSNYHKGFLLNLIRAMVPGENKAIEGEENTLLTYAIEQAYSNARSQVQVSKDSDLVWEEELEPFYLSDFKRTLLSLSSVGDQPLTAKERDMATSLARRLEQWCGNTPLGKFIDGPTTLATADARAVLYETSSFDKHKQLDAVGTMLIQNEIWNQATKSRQRRMILAIDEAWAITQNPYSCAFVVEMARRGAKEGVALWLLTHSIKDVVGPGREGLLGMNTYYLFKLNSEDAEVQEYLKLSDRIMEEYQSLTGQKGHYNEFLLVSKREGGDEAAILRLITSPKDYWYLTNDADDLAVIEQMVEIEGSEERAIQKLALEGVA